MRPNTTPACATLVIADLFDCCGPLESAFWFSWMQRSGWSRQPPVAVAVASDATFNSSIQKQAAARPSVTTIAGTRYFREGAPMPFHIQQLPDI